MTTKGITSVAQWRRHKKETHTYQPSLERGPCLRLFVSPFAVFRLFFCDLPTLPRGSFPFNQLYALTCSTLAHLAHPHTSICVRNIKKSIEKAPHTHTVFDLR